jgi:hypothetical protein
MVEAPKPPLPKNSDAWKSHLRPWINRRIDELRDRLEDDGAPVEEIRGRLKELRELKDATEPDLPDLVSPGYFPPGNNSPS